MLAFPYQSCESTTDVATVGSTNTHFRITCPLTPRPARSRSQLDTSKQTIIEHFESKRCRVTQCRTVLKGDHLAAFVDLADWRSVKNALKCHGTRLAGRRITVRRCLDSTGVQQIVKQREHGGVAGARQNRPQQKKQTPKQKQKPKKTKIGKGPVNDVAATQPKKKKARLSQKKRKQLALEKSSSGFM